MKDTDEVPAMQSVDDRAGHENPGRNATRKASAVRVCEPSPIRHDGVRRRGDWPFLYYQGQDGRTYLNPVKRSTRAPKDIAEALL